jgi:hypothetical protein
VVGLPWAVEIEKLVSTDVTTFVAYKVVVKVCSGPGGVQEVVTVVPGSVTCWLFVSMLLEAGVAWIRKGRRDLFSWHVSRCILGALSYFLGWPPIVIIFLRCGDFRATPIYVLKEGSSLPSFPTRPQCLWISQLRQRSKFRLELSG